MFSFHKPSEREIRGLLARQSASQFSYPHVGASERGFRPQGYACDHNRVCLGSGEQTFDRAVDAFGSWQMFRIGWLQLCWPDAPIRVGTDVAVVVRHYGFWSVNCSRIVYTVDEGGEVQKYGLGYGTLLEHAESGEERFLIEWNRRDDSVWYDLFAFSRPRATLAQLGHPLARRLQRRFAAASLRAMADATNIRYA